LLDDGVNINKTDGKNTPLTLAIFMKDGEMVKILLAFKANVNLIAYKDSPLIEAVRVKSIPIIWSLLRKGADPNIKGACGISALHIAADNLAILHILLPITTLSACVDNNGETPLQLAIEKGNLDCVKVLCKYFNAFYINAENCNMLKYALRAKKKDIVEFLFQLETSKDFFDVNDAIYKLARSTSYMEMKMDILLLLLNHRSFKIDYFMKDGRTALHVAAEKDNAKVGLKLLEYGFTIDKTDNDKKTALHIAALHFSPKMTVLLLYHKADVNAIDRLNFTPLLCAANNTNYLKTIINDQVLTVKALINAEPNLDYQTEHDDKTALHLACKQGNLTMIRALCVNGADMELKDRFHQTPLYSALHDPTATLVLLKYGANPNATDSSLCTPLHIATTLNSVLVASILITFCDVNLKNSIDMSAFDIACANNFFEIALSIFHSPHFQKHNFTKTFDEAVSRGYVEIAKLLFNDTVPSVHDLFHAVEQNYPHVVNLLIAKVDLNARNSQGDTPLIIAATRGHKIIIKILIDANANKEATNNKGQTALAIVKQGSYSMSDKHEIQAWLL
jgi:ankyrin repeat protein